MPIDHAGARAVAVFLVEDNDDLRELYAEMLGDEGYDLVLLSSAEAAIERARRVRPAVVVTDLSMPGTSGLELCDYFVRDYPAPTPAVVIVSAIGEAAAEARRRGASSFVAKPFTPEELRFAVRAALGGRPPSTGRATSLEEVDEAKRRTRATTRAIAEGALEAALANDPALRERTMHVMRWLASFYGTTVASVLCARDGSVEVLVSSDRELLPTDEPAPLPLSILALNALETSSTVLVPNIEAQPWLGAEPSAFRSYACVPFRYHDVPVGVVCLSSLTPRSIGAPDLAILESVGSASTARLSGARAAPLMTPSGLLSREGLRLILDIEIAAAAAGCDGVAIALLGVSSRKALGHILDDLPARRMVLAELRDDVVAIASRAREEEALEEVRRGEALVRARVDSGPCAEILVAAPVPRSIGPVLLEWAERLLDGAYSFGPRGRVTVDASPTWGPSERAA